MLPNKLYTKLENHKELFVFLLVDPVEKLRNNNKKEYCKANIIGIIFFFNIYFYK